MPIIRSRHTFDEQFTTIPNAWVRDPRITLKAKGLLVQLMSHSPGWAVTIRSLADANGCGRDLITSAISELEKCGYLIRRQERTENGQFGETVWQTSEPGTDSPSPENPAPENPAYKNTNYSEQQVKETSLNDLDELFEDFWNRYPRKVEKLDALRAFTKAYRQHGPDVMAGVERLVNDPNLPPVQFIPYPASWLRAGGWTNEPYPPRERTNYELAADAIRRSQADRMNRLADSQRIRKEAEEARRNAAPAPECEHGLSLWKCDPCTRRLADGPPGDN